MTDARTPEGSRADRGVGQRAFLVALAVGAVALFALDVERVVQRLHFDYDLLLWGDDYFMTSMEKLAAGLPVYTQIADANSTVYSPGGPWLHHVLLSPFHADTSLLANRLLNLTWLALSLFLFSRAVLALLDRTAGASPSRLERLLLRVLVFSTLGVAALANPVTDSLHPTNLELVVLGVTFHSLAVWPELSRRRRIALSVALPALAMLAKQTTGVSVAAVIALVLFLGERGSLVRRVSTAAVPALSLGLSVAVVVGVTHGLFATWGFSILAHHPFDWWKVKDIYAGYFLLFVPSLVTATVAAFVRRGRADSSPFFRAFLLFHAVTPPCLAALFKTMGGPNNLAVPGFLLVALALPFFTCPLFIATRFLPWALPVLLAVQLGVLHPRRRVPDAHDESNARLICDFAARRMRCGESVFLGRGSVCFARGGVAVPIDRLSSIVEVTVAGRATELGFHERVRSEQYDVLIIPINDLIWFGGDFWKSLRARYAPFFQTKGELENDFWFDGWQGYATWPMVFFERARDRGKHRVDGSSGCE